MSDDVPELTDVRFGVARLRGENERLARERAAELRAGNRGFGSPLRRWLREERGAENASFASAMTAEERAASPLHLGVPFQKIETRTMTVPYDFRRYALARLHEELGKLPEVEGDGFVTVYPRPAGLSAHLPGR